MRLRVSLMACGALFAAVSAPAAARQDPMAALMQQQFAEVSGWVTKAAEIVPADKYGYTPVGTVRTFGQQVGHIADAHNYYCGQAAGRQTEWAETVEKGPNDKTTLMAKLKLATDGCTAAFVSTGPANAPPLLGAISHTNLHYGNVIVYMRMLGLVPPSS